MKLGLLPFVAFWIALTIVVPGPVASAADSDPNLTNIQLSAHIHNEFLVIEMTSSMLPGQPTLVLHMETIWINQPFPPFSFAEKLEETRVGDILKLRVAGRLERKKAGVIFPPEGQKLPYVMEFTLTPEPYRVLIEGRMEPLPGGIAVEGFNPCFQNVQFSLDNRPPFEMARQCFTFFKGKGFGWFADADRARSEKHTTDEGGPWIQHFRVSGRHMEKQENRYSGKFSPTEEALPLIGWVARNKSSMIAITAPRAVDIATRWFPCLHTDMLTDQSDGISFRATAYMMPANLDLLIDRCKKDMGLNSESLFQPSDALWPYREGVLLDGLEKTDAWRPQQGQIQRYPSPAVWINGNHEKIQTPEGITEGAGSALWEIQSPKDTPTLSCVQALPSEIGRAPTHVSMDAMNRGTDDMTLEVSVEANGRMVSRQFDVRKGANRRLLIPITQIASETDPLKQLLFKLKVTPGQDTVRLVLDNLRIYPSIEK